jgi:hypothetical protein
MMIGRGRQPMWDGCRVPDGHGTGLPFLGGAIIAITPRRVRDLRERVEEIRDPADLPSALFASLSVAASSRAGRLASAAVLPTENWPDPPAAAGRVCRASGLSVPGGR